MTDIMPLTEAKSLCVLIRAYCKGEISRETFWQCRDGHFIQGDLFNA